MELQSVCHGLPSPKMGLPTHRSVSHQFVSTYCFFNLKLPNFSFQIYSLTLSTLEFIPFHYYLLFLRFLQVSLDWGIKNSDLGLPQNVSFSFNIVEYTFTCHFGFWEISSVCALIFDSVFGILKCNNALIVFLLNGLFGPSIFEAWFEEGV